MALAKTLPASETYTEGKFFPTDNIETSFGDDSDQVDSTAAVYNGGDVQLFKINSHTDTNVDDYNIDISVPLKTEKCEYPLHPRSSKFDIFLANLLENLPKETLAGSLNNEDDLLPIGYNFADGFEYSLKPMILQGNYDDFSTFIELATRTFLSLNDVRGRLSYMHDHMNEPIPTAIENTFSFYTALPLSKTNAWIWMCAEIIELFEQSKNVLQDIRQLEICQNYILEQLLQINEQMTNLQTSLLDFQTSFHRFNELFREVNSTIRNYFSEAISSEVEGLRLRFLEESEERSSGLITVLSRSSPATIQELEQEKNEFVGWGIDGVSIKTKNEFNLLNFTKTNSTRFLSDLKEFFGGFENFLKRMNWVIIGISKAFSKPGHEPSSILITLLNLASTIYVYPMEQTRGVQVFWQLEEVIKESLEFITELVHNLGSTQHIWRTAFGKEIGKGIKFNVSFQPFMEWKLCSRLMFKLKILESELPKKSGTLCLMVPNTCPNNAPLFFQVFENTLCSIVDFEKEYEHRRERIKKTEKVLQEDIIVCSDVLQQVYFISNGLAENVQYITNGFMSDVTKIGHPTQASNGKLYSAINVWCFICTECLLSMKALILKDAEKEWILRETENCFQSVNQWMKVVVKLKRKYSQELVRIQKLRRRFPEFVQENKSVGLGLETTLEEMAKEQRPFEDIVSPCLSTNEKKIISILIRYDGLSIEQAGHSYNIRSLESPDFISLTKLFLKRTQTMMSAMSKSYTACLDLLNSRNKNGIRQQVADMESKLESVVHLNPLEILIGQLCLNNLYTQTMTFVEHLTDVLVTKDIIKHDLEFPMKVLKQKLTRRWWVSQVKVDSVADHIGALIKVPINEDILASELEIYSKELGRTAQVILIDY